ncbi:hypothetical protein [Kaarinaea lacus]
MFKYTFICLSFLLTTACGGGGDGGSGVSAACSEGSSPYHGCWITTGCQSVDNPITNEPVWAVNRFSFSTSGNIDELIKVYTNSSCTGSPVYEEESFTDLAFEEMGAEMLQSGLTGYRLRVEDVETNGQGVSEVLVTVANNQLCLSNNLQLSAGGYLFVFQSNATEVDFNNCLDGI